MASNKDDTPNKDSQLVKSVLNTWKRKMHLPSADPTTAEPNKPLAKGVLNVWKQKMDKAPRSLREALEKTLSSTKPRKPR